MKLLFLLLTSISLLFAIELQKPKIYKSQNIKGWYMSEKLDGIRGFWNGKKFLSKNGHEIFVPKEFIKNFPNFKLDGELWTKRGDFENIQSIVLDSNPSKKWNQITFNIFEVPEAKGDLLQRLNKAKKWFLKHPNKHVEFIKQIKCESKKDLDKFLEKLLSKNAEGVVIKNGTLDYFTGRNKNILKVKKFFDTEGKVIGINFDKEDKERMKSLKIKLENGVIFNLGGGFSNKQRYNYPKIGETVTFKYYGFTKNKKPKFASFMRVRKEE
ncbi:DNA ligase [Arcobacter sp. CECT 8985]|uniref:DNA ligase n=1 Tax=Arcobacter sp. CECT 8985 TaxID=1935424 RepID=UPI00100C1CF1|nr:DNA ligase [Arcobacter sp. CECT 8985]RXJ85272.1 DNA ligase [Arcobacter sp. CECT 8985]